MNNTNEDTETDDKKAGEFRPGRKASFLAQCMAYLFVAIMIVSPFILFFEYLGLPIPNPTKKTVVEKDKSLGDASGQVAMLEITGVISGVTEIESNWLNAFCSKIDELSKDDNVKSILIQIHSPGGGSTASNKLYHAIRKANGRKPVVAYIPSIAASGGYMAASAATTIITDKHAWTGSIGVIMKYRNIHGTYKLLGMDMQTFKSGEMKDMWSKTRPVHEKEIEYTQTIIDRNFQEFVDLVAESRNLTPEEVRERAGDGRIILGEDALRLGLVDRLGDFDDAVLMARELGHAKGAKVVLHKVRWLQRLVESLAAKGPGTQIRLDFLEETRLETTAGTEWSQPYGQPLLMYLP